MDVFVGGYDSRESPLSLDSIVYDGSIDVDQLQELEDRVVDCFRALKPTLDVLGQEGRMDFSVQLEFLDGAAKEVGPLIVLIEDVLGAIQAHPDLVKACPSNDIWVFLDGVFLGSAVILSAIAAIANLKESFRAALVIDTGLLGSYMALKFWRWVRNDSSADGIKLREISTRLRAYITLNDSLTILRKNCADSLRKKKRHQSRCSARQRLRSNDCLSVPNRLSWAYSLRSSASGYHSGNTTDDECSP